MLGGLNEITALELFTQNYLIWGRISFTIWKRIQFWMYPPGAQLSRPLHLLTQRLYFFCKILDLIRIWSDSDPDLIRAVFVEKMCGSAPDQSRIRFGSDPKFKKKFRTRFLTLETPEAIYNYCAPGGWYTKQIIYWTKKSKKLSFNSFGVQSHLFIEIV